MAETKISYARPYTNEWKLFLYLKDHKSVTSRDSKYPPLEIMDLPKLISNLTEQGYTFAKEWKSRENSHGIVKRYVEYTLLDKVEIKEGK